MTKAENYKKYLRLLLNAGLFWVLLFAINAFIRPIEALNILFIGCLATSLVTHKKLALFLVSTVYILFSNLIFSPPIIPESLFGIDLIFRMKVYFSVLLLFFILTFFRKYNLLKFPFITIFVIYLLLKYEGVKLGSPYLTKMSVIWSLGSWVLVYALKAPKVSYYETGSILLPWQFFYQYPITKPESQEKLKKSTGLLTTTEKGSVALILMIMGYGLLHLGLALIGNMKNSEITLAEYFKNVHLLGGVPMMQHFVKYQMVASLNLKMIAGHYANGALMILNFFCMAAFPFALVQFCNIELAFPLGNPFKSSSFFDFFKRIMGPFVKIMFNLFFIPSWTFFSKIIKSHKLRVLAVLAWVIIGSRFILRAVPLGLIDNSNVDQTMMFLNSSRDQFAFVLLMITQTIVLFSAYKLRYSNVITNTPVIIRSIIYFLIYYTTYLFISILVYLLHL